MNSEDELMVEAIKFLKFFLVKLNTGEMEFNEIMQIKSKMLGNIDINHNNTAYKWICTVWDVFTEGASKLNLC